MADLTVLAQVAVGGLLTGALYALLASGLTLIFGVMRVINIAHADFMIVGAYVTFWLFELAHLNPLLSLPVSVAVLLFLGMTTQRAVVARVVGRPELTSLLLMYGVSILVQNLQLQFFTADYRSTPFLTGSVEIAGVAVPLARAVAAVVAILITGGTYFYLKTSLQGKAIRATAQHADVAAICGIDVDRVRMFAFGLGTALAGASGTLLVTLYAVNPDTGHLFILKAFSCIVLGGMGNFAGALGGGLILGLAEAFGGFMLNPQLAEAIGYGILVLVLLFRPNGILAGGRR